MLRILCGDAKTANSSANSLITIPPSWLFACWSLDMIGPFTMAPSGFTHVLVAIDKFTKWIEYGDTAYSSCQQVALLYMLRFS
jgi:hypothetical protein